MREKQRHIDAFEDYYALGPKRSLDKLLGYYTKTTPTDMPGIDSLKHWSAAFSWQERIMLRDREISKKTEKRIINEEIDIRVAAHQSIMNTRDMFLACIGTAFIKDKKTGINAVSPDVAIRSARELSAMLLGVIKCEEAGLHILAPESEQKPIPIDVTVSNIDPAIAKEAAKLITKLQSEQNMAEKKKE